MKKKTILFITTGQPSSNPRLVKEVGTLLQSGYIVKVICCYYYSWAAKFDREIIANSPDVYHYCGGSPSQDKVLYFFTRLRQKISNYLFSKGCRILSVAENAISRTHAESIILAKKFTPDLVIAHNLGALPAAVMAANYHKVKAGYDAEDMHSAQFETADSWECRLNKLIEEKYFPETAYFTAASPLIGENYKKAYPYLDPVVINNVFSSKFQSAADFKKSIENVNNNQLKLFWFSQTIGKGRGIEEVIQAIGLVQNKQISLNLLGQINDDKKKYFHAIALENKLDTSRISFISPIPPDNIFAFASQFDIGLALEQNTPLNRDICLTNKIFTYLISGLAVIATETQAQKKLLEQYPDIGKSYRQRNIEELASIINHYSENKNALINARQNAFDTGTNELNWEKESEIFLSVIARILTAKH